MNKDNLNITFIALIALNLCVIWSVSPFPTADGPGHLHMIHMWMNYESVDLFRHFYDKHPAISGYRFIYWLLWPLVQVFSYETAEHILMSIYVIGFPIAGYYALMPITKNAKVFSLFFPVITLNFPFMIGLFNTSFSLIFVLIGFGYWLRIKNKIKLNQGIYLTCITLILFATHIFGLYQLYFWIGCSFLYDALIERKKPFRVLLKKEWLPVFWVFLPSLILSGYFFFNMEEYSFIFSNNMGFFDKLVLRFIDLFAFQTLSIATHFEHFLSVAFGFTLLAVSCKKMSEKPSQLSKMFCFSFILYCLIYLLTPLEGIGIPLLADRLLLFITLFFFFLVSSFDYNKAQLRTFYVSLGCLAIIFAGLRFEQTQTIKKHADDYLSIAEHVQPHSTLLRVHKWHNLKETYDRSRTIPLQHLSSRIGYEKNIVNLSLWPPPQGYLPVGYKTSLNPYFYMTNDKRLSLLIGGAAPAVDIGFYEKKSQHKIDYITTMGSLPEGWSYGGWHGQNISDLENQLGEKYTPIFTSPNGTTKLYKRR